MRTGKRTERSGCPAHGPGAAQPRRSEGSLRPRVCLAAAALLVFVSGALASCADRQVTVRFGADPTLPPLTAPAALTIFDFGDQRGSEGDHDVFRVGGIYLGFSTRVVKVMTDTPWPRTLSAALIEAFAERGVPSTNAFRAWSPGVPFATPLALAGDIQNFSTEFRLLGTSAHISGVVRVSDQQGRILVEKRVSERQSWDLDKGAPTSDEALQATLNRALAGFVSKIVTDPDIDRVLAGTVR